MSTLATIIPLDEADTLSSSEVSVMLRIGMYDVFRLVVKGKLHPLEDARGGYVFVREDVVAYQKTLEKHRGR